MLEQILLLTTTPLLALGIGFFSEAITEYLFAWLFDLPALKKYKPALVYIPLIPAVLLSVFYKVDLMSFAIYAFNALAETDFTPIPSSAVGFVISGLLIARFSGWIHDYVVNKLKILKGEEAQLKNILPFGRSPEA